MNPPPFLPEINTVAGNSLLGEPTTADAIVDRVIKRAHRIALKGSTKGRNETITT
jgi:hypothetical protein